MTPVEELARALRRAALHLGHAAAGHDCPPCASAAKEASAALSRFNAEMGDGVWAPREPTEAMCKAGSIKTRNEGQDASGRRTTRFLHPEVIGAAYRAMITASQTPPAIPEGNDG